MAKYSKKDKAFQLFPDSLEALTVLADEFGYESVGKVVIGLLLHMNHIDENNSELDLTPVEKFALKPLIAQYDRDSERYEEICAKNRENQRKRWEKDKATADKNDTTVYDGIRPYTMVEIRTNNNNNNNIQQQHIANTNDVGCSGDIVESICKHAQVEYGFKTITAPMRKGIVEALEHLPEDVINSAFECAAINQPSPTWSYASKIIKRYIAEGIDTLEKVQEDNAKHTGKAGSSEQVQTIQPKVFRED